MHRAGRLAARRDLLSSLLDAPYAAMMAAHDRALDSALMEAVSPRDKTGWAGVDLVSFVVIFVRQPRLRLTEPSATTGCM